MSSGAVAAGSSGGGRPRSGVWALLTRLRRPASSDSLSSAGSDATLSFAYLAPQPSDHLPFAHEPTPLTDTYKNRVRERNERRQHDRDLTLHRKYGLIRGDATFDAFSLPHARRSLLEPTAAEARERRAVSESLPRCAAHVPGKRRAPPPPSHHASLTRRHSRKRPAPPPPTKPDITKDIEKENIDINTLVKMRSNKSEREKRPMSNDGTNLNYKSDKSSKKDSNAKVPKMKREKSFLQQIFEGKKRSSAIEPAPERILPSITELDKQAAAIIDTFRLKPLSQSNRGNAAGSGSDDAWFCTRCLRKYNATVVTCLYCLPEQNNLRNAAGTERYTNNHNTANIYTQIDSDVPCSASSSRVHGVAMDEKDKLKEMLKEIKDSLPKRTKLENKEEPRSETKNSKAISKTRSKVISVQTTTVEVNYRDDNVNEQEETGNNRDSYYDPVTLRIGSNDHVVTDKHDKSPLPSTSKQNVVSNPNKVPAENREYRFVNVKTEPVKEIAVVTQPVVLVAPQPTNHDDIFKKVSKNAHNNIGGEESSSKIAPTNGTIQTENLGSQKEDKLLSKPITLTSLLNPIYIPQQSTALDRRRLFFSQAETPSSASKLNPKEPSENNRLPASSSAQQSSKTLSVSVTTSSTTSETKPVREDKIRIENIGLTKQATPLPVANSPKPKTSSQDPVTSQKPLSTFTSVSTTTSNTPLSGNSKLSNANSVILSVDQHSKRREWVNQLEQSIAKGDEIAAAQAAAKLAQLRVACSVLSFSSQIVGESSKQVQSKPSNSSLIEADGKKPQLEANQSKSKVNAAVQSMEVVSPKGISKKADDDLRSAAGGSNLHETKHSPAMTKAESSTSKTTTLAQKTIAAASTSALTVNSETHLVDINVWVEDREATRGPILLRVSRHGAVGALRRRAEEALGLPARLQRWIVGRTLCTDDRTLLASVAGPQLNEPFYLCLVEDTNTATELTKTESKLPINATPQIPSQETSVYSELVALEARALVPNAEPFECGVCMDTCAAGQGAVLRECAHTFCRPCLQDLVRHSTDAVLKCPETGCAGTLQEREVRSVASAEQYEGWLSRGLAAAESGARHAFHCRTRDCKGWALVEPPVTKFPCPVCKHNNCIPCQAIHEGETCEEHRARLHALSSTDRGDDDRGTRALLDDLIAKGEALECPECSAIITKKWGCDWVKCSACKTEICWVTRGKRWGPGGRGDTSAGCRCGVDGRRCHTACGYCH